LSPTIRVIRCAGWDNPWTVDNKALPGFAESDLRCGL